MANDLIIVRIISLPRWSQKRGLSGQRTSLLKKRVMVESHKQHSAKWPPLPGWTQAVFENCRCYFSPLNCARRNILCFSNQTFRLFAIYMYFDVLAPWFAIIEVITVVLPRRKKPVAPLKNTQCLQSRILKQNILPLWLVK